MTCNLLQKLSVVSPVVSLKQIAKKICYYVVIVCMNVCPFKSNMLSIVKIPRHYLLCYHVLVCHFVLCTRWRKEARLDQRNSKHNFYTMFNWFFWHELDKKDCTAFSVDHTLIDWHIFTTSLMKCWIFSSTLHPSCPFFTIVELFTNLNLKKDNDIPRSSSKLPWFNKLLKCVEVLEC